MKLYDGMRVKCKIKNTEIVNAVITKEGDNFYICQDLQDGSWCKDKKGFKYSWFIGGGFDKSLRYNNAINLRPLSSTNIIYIYVGATVKDKYNNEYEVVGNADKVWFIVGKESGFLSTHTFSNLKNNGFTLVSEVVPDEIEVVIKKNGVVSDAKLSVETARSMGIVE